MKLGIVNIAIDLSLTLLTDFTYGSHYSLAGFKWSWATLKQWSSDTPILCIYSEQPKCSSVTCVSIVTGSRDLLMLLSRNCRSLRLTNCDWQFVHDNSHIFPHPRSHLRFPVKTTSGTTLTLTSLPCQGFWLVICLKEHNSAWVRTWLGGKLSLFHEVKDSEKCGQTGDSDDGFKFKSSDHITGGSKLTDWTLLTSKIPTESDGEEFLQKTDTKNQWSCYKINFFLM